ncbi:hypothetical protein QBC36DRAFT_328904 [Triangularia setosa]|uniref:Uncharacterized protein n=1 Tax=Triangularia setosa TaxID=2587417 RepID=A0AAN7A762_9PEZI|nr:hypothetical protein QBC36DRAFT_328904 [Podospora setosa]
MNQSTESIAPSAATVTPQGATRPGPIIHVRKYGNNDFEIFDQERARGSHISVGTASIGKVDIDCRYRWKRAQWGILGHGTSERPAGIVYMDIAFKQPPGYWLKHATVFVTLSRDTSVTTHTGGRRSRKTPPRHPLDSDYAVQITEQFGPKYLTGTKTVQSEVNSKSAIPTVAAMGFEFGGIGHQSMTAKDRVGRWVFKGTVARPKMLDDYCTLEWELIGNELDPSEAHKPEYNTAFAFEHSARPIIMRVDVEGKLQSKSRQLKHGWLSFSSNRTSTLTHLDLSKTVGLNKTLDQIAKGLELAMQMENCGNPPVEVSGPTPAQFLPSNPSPSDFPGHNGNLPNQTTCAHQQLNGSHQTPHTVESHRVRASQHMLEASTCQASTDPLYEALQRHKIRNRQQVPAHIRLEKTTRASGEGDSGYETQAPEDTEILQEEHGNKIPLSSPTKPSHVPPQHEALEQAFKEISRIPAILVVINFLVIISRWFAKPQAPLPVINVGSWGTGENETQNRSNGAKESAVSFKSEASGYSETLVCEDRSHIPAKLLSNMPHVTKVDEHNESQRKMRTRTTHVGEKRQSADGSW